MPSKKSKLKVGDLLRLKPVGQRKWPAWFVWEGNHIGPGGTKASLYHQTKITESDAILLIRVSSGYFCFLYDGKEHSSIKGLGPDLDSDFEIIGNG